MTDEPDRGENARSRKEFIRLITAKWNERGNVNRELGKMLNDAKEELDHGEFLMMIEHQLPFGPRKAEQLMAIYADPVLGNATRESNLPESYVTRYEIWKLRKLGVTDAQLNEMIADHTIHPDMQLKEVQKLRADINEHGVYWWTKVANAFAVLFEFMHFRQSDADIEQCIKHLYEMWGGGLRVHKQLGPLWQRIKRLDERVKAKLSDPEEREAAQARLRFKESVKLRREFDARRGRRAKKRRPSIFGDVLFQPREE